MNSQNFDFLLKFTRKHITKDVMKSIDIAMILEPYTDSIKELIELNDGDESMAIVYMSHDYIGLSANDEYFLPILTKN